MDAVLAPIDLCTVTSVWTDENINNDTEKIEKLTKQLQDADMQLDDYKHDLNNLTNEIEHANKEREAYKNHCRILLKKIDRIKKATKGTAVSFIGDTKTECDNLFKCWEDETRARSTADRKYSKLLHTIDNLIDKYTTELDSTMFKSDVQSKERYTVLNNILLVLNHLKNETNK